MKQSLGIKKNNVFSKDLNFSFGPGTYTENTATIQALRERTVSEGSLTKIVEKYCYSNTTKGKVKIKKPNLNLRYKYF